jgi:hypothetical protein
VDGVERDAGVMEVANGIWVESGVYRSWIPQSCLAFQDTRWHSGTKMAMGHCSAPTCVHGRGDVGVDRAALWTLAEFGGSGR